MRYVIKMIANNGINENTYSLIMKSKRCLLEGVTAGLCKFKVAHLSSGIKFVFVTKRVILQLAVDVNSASSMCTLN